MFTAAGGSVVQYKASSWVHRSPTGTSCGNQTPRSDMKGGGFGQSGSERCGNAASRGLATVPVTVESELAELMGRRLRRRGLIVIFFSMYPRAAGRGPRAEAKLRSRRHIQAGLSSCRHGSPESIRARGPSRTWKSHAHSYRADCCMSSNGPNQSRPHCGRPAAR